MSNPRLKKDDESEESEETSSVEGQDEKKTASAKRNYPPPVADMFNPNTAFIHDTPYPRNLGAASITNPRSYPLPPLSILPGLGASLTNPRTSSPLSALPADRKRKGLDDLMKEMSIEPAMSPKFIPPPEMNLNHPNFQSDKRHKGITLAVDADVEKPAPGSLYPSPRRHS
jgi:hypothetical protein